MKRLTQTLLLLAALLLPVGAFAQSTIVLDLNGTKPGVYYYSIKWDGTNAALVPIQNVIQVGNGGVPAAPMQSTPNDPFVPTPGPPAPVVPPGPPVAPPTPQPPAQPAPTDTIEHRVQDVTQRAISSGGSVKTAVFLQRVYSIVSSAIDSGQISKERAFEALREATNLALEQQPGEAARWAPWRTGVSGVIVGERDGGRLLTKEQYVTLLRHVGNAIKTVVNSTIAMDRSRDLKEGDYEQIIQFQQRVADTIKNYKVPP